MTRRPLRLLMVAKAPVGGRVKTRLGAEIGMTEAAQVAAAAMIDSIVACAEAVGSRRCHLSLSGDLAMAERGDEIRRLLDGWVVTPQVGADFSERLARAHLEVGAGPLVQIGMDTPQVTAADLLASAADLVDHDAVLGPAEDGGWWALALREAAQAVALRGVPMSTPTTYDDTRAALLRSGSTVAVGAVLRDVDTVADAVEVAAVAPDGEFARAWNHVGSPVR